MVNLTGSARSATFRTALVGCGRIFSTHVAALKELPDVEIIAACDLNETLVCQRAIQHGIGDVFTDFETMMREVRPDVVHLLTPPRSHLTLTKIAAQYGAHIYVEKPLASNEADALAMAAAAEHAGVSICPGHNRLFDPPFLEAHRRIRAGEIGRVVSVRAEQGFAYEAMARAASIPWSYTYDWGIFENLIPHSLYLVSHFLQEPGLPKVIGFNLDRVHEATVEEIRVLIPSATAVGEVVLSLTTAPVHNRIEVIGTRGRIVVDFVGLNVVCTKFRELPSLVTRFTSNLEIAFQLIRSTLGVAAGILIGRIKQYMGVRTLVREFYQSLRQGSPPPVLPEHGVLNVRQMDQIKAACVEVSKKRIAVDSKRNLSTASRVLVTGATGFLGGRLVQRLAAEGIPVRGTTRLASRARPLMGVEWVECNLLHEDELRRALGGIETIFHCAALVGAPGSLEDYEEANVKGTVRLAMLAAEAGVKRLVYISSISVYAKPLRNRPYVEEDAPYDHRAGSRGLYTQSKLEADRALLEYACQHDTPVVIVLRPGTIYGPGTRLPVGRFPLPSPRRLIVAGGRHVPMPLTYVDNLIDAILAARPAEVPSGSIYNVVDSPDLTQGEIARILREVSRGRIRPIFLPYPLVWMMMLGIDLFSLLRNGRMGTARYRLERTLADMRYRCIAARQQLGWQPSVMLAEGLRRILETSEERPFPH